jgi:ParB/RepB/Spo0J family partition protein
MNTITKTFVTVEHHCLQLSYASLRLHRPRWVDRLAASIERHGQLVPVVVVSLGENQWALIDGYLRVKALRRLGQDIINAEAWACDLAQALIALLTEHQSRAWAALEEALLLQELHAQHGFSQGRLAEKTGRDQSWVSRRLSLLEQLPDSVRQAMIQGKLSPWGATRVMAPMARAIPSHAELLLQYVLKQPLSTRELRCFYDHYQRSSHPQRLRMVKGPDLFFKAQKSLMLEKQARTLQAGPAGQWKSQLRVVRNILVSLLPLASTVFMPGQEAEEHRQLIEIFNATKTSFELLTETLRSCTDADKRHTADHYQSA